MGECPILIVFPYSAKDQDQAVRLAEWIRELGQNKSHRVLIVRDRRCDLEHDRVIRAALEQSFAAAETLTVNDDAYDSWPESANTMFRNAAKHIEFTSKEPFLWLEPDVAPLKEGWLDAIVAEYASCGKPFMGDRVEVEGVPLHMSGVAVYPGIMSNFAGLAYLAQDIAWDVAAAAQIVPQAHFTSLIEHSWKRDPVTKEYSHVTFANWEQVEREIAPDTVLYHASKDGSLIRLLRERKNNLPVSRMMDLDAGKMADDGPKADIGHADGEQLAVCDIFVKSWEGDREWLHYCLRSVEKFASGFSEVILVLPNGMGFVNPLCKRWLIHEPEGEDSYLRQQKEKLYADTLTDATHILFLDSDTIFTCPVTPQTYLKDGRILWMMTPWEKTNTPWRPIVEKFMGQPVEFEFMRRHPTVVPRWLLAAVREFCLKQHGMPLDQYVMSQPHREFSEFNVLGAFAYAFHRDQFYWVNTEEVPPDEWPELTVKQGFSWDGLTDDVRQEFEAILGKEGDAPCRQSNDSMILASSAAPTSDPDSAAIQGTTRFFKVEQVPWESKEQSLEEIRGLAGRLKNFCGKASQVRAVRLELHNAGVIELPYRFRRRKGKWRSKKK